MRLIKYVRSLTRAVLADTAYHRMNIEVLDIGPGKTCVQVCHHDRDDRLLGAEVYIPACEANNIDKTIEAIDRYVSDDEPAPDRTHYVLQTEEHNMPSVLQDYLDLGWRPADLVLR